MTLSRLISLFLWFLLAAASGAQAGSGTESLPATYGSPVNGHQTKTILAAPTYFSLEPFTVKVEGAQADTYLNTQMYLRTRNKKYIQLLNEYRPEIRHKVLLILSHVDPAALNDSARLQGLAVEIRSTINSIVKDAAKGDPVDAVLFGTFMVQM